MIDDTLIEEIKGISNNSKNIKEGYLFVAIKGNNLDGHLFIEDAIKRGARFILLQDRDLKDVLSKKYPYVRFFISENTRKSQALISKRFFKNPDRYLNIIAVTGTNGKTTVSNLIYQYLNFAGKNAGIIGTIYYKYKENLYSSGRTTPDSIEWYSLLLDMYRKGAQYVVAEISSHALDQYRVYGTRFSGAIFTNLTQDHLDYHKTMEHYFNSKKFLFDYISETNPEATVSINIDDEYGKRIYKSLKGKIKNLVDYGKDKSRFQIKNIEISTKGTLFDLYIDGKKYRIKTDLLGFFNVYNLTAAISYLYTEGFSVDFLVENAKKLKPVKGRFETVYAGEFLVVNDYAHTPDALANILRSLKQINHRRIIVVFGAGGDRDKGKRPLMGEISEKYADIIILTSDNPRSEKPEDIIKDIKSGIKKDVIVEVDRENAIKRAISLAEKGDIILVAGKGHETYQIVGDKKYYFDDTEVIKKYLKEKKIQPL